MSFHYRIVTPKGVFYEGEADIINIPLTQGLTGILPHHFPLVSMIDTGKVTIRYQGVTRELAISGGVLHVQNEETLILANAIEFKEQIDVERAKQAETRARDRLSHKEDSNIDVKRAELALKRALNRINIAGK